MNWRIRMKKRHALFVLVATCSAISYLFGFIAHAETVRGEEGRFETGDTLEVETGLGDGYIGIHLSGYGLPGWISVCVG